MLGGLTWGPCKPDASYGRAESCWVDQWGWLSTDIAQTRRHPSQWRHTRWRFPHDRRRFCRSRTHDILGPWESSLRFCRCKGVPHGNRSRLLVVVSSFADTIGHSVPWSQSAGVFRWVAIRRVLRREEPLVFARVLLTYTYASCGCSSRGLFARFGDNQMRVVAANRVWCQIICSEFSRGDLGSQLVFHLNQVRSNACFFSYNLFHIKERGGCGSIKCLAQNKG